MELNYDWSKHVPGSHEIELYSGRFLDVTAPDPYLIELRDVAEGLSKACRFTGQCRDYYSVAQHAVMCSRYVERVGGSLIDQLAALHHDDAEAFLSDIARPVKGLLQPAYGDLSDRMDRAIANAFKGTWPANALKVPIVKEADNWALMIEARRLLPSQGRHWSGQACNWDLDVEFSDSHADLWTGYESPRTACARFVERHEALEWSLS